MLFTQKHKLTVFVLNNNLEAAGKVRKYIKKKLKDNVHVSIFLNCKSCLNKIDDHVDAVVLNDFLYYWGKDGIHGHHLLEQIKSRNPHAQIIITNKLSGSAFPICRLRQHPPNFPGTSYKLHLNNFVNRFIEQPVIYMVAEIGLKNFMKLMLLMMTLFTILSITALSVTEFNR